MPKWIFARNSLFIALLIASSASYASGYRIESQSVSVASDAGEAAVVDDASTNWYNSAGLVRLPQQVVFSAIELMGTSKFGGSATAPSLVNQLPPPFNLFGSNYAASTTASSQPRALNPAFHYSLPLNNRVALGLSVVPVWGVMEDYGYNSVLRYNLTRIYTKTIDIAPSIAFRLNPQWSVGLGPDFNYWSIESRANVRTQGLVPFGTLGDSVSRFSVNDWGYGAHIGALYEYDPRTRIGLNYRTKIMMNMSGFSDFVVDQGPHYETKTFKLPVPLPPSTTLSVYRDINPVWALMGTIAYDQWSVLRDYHARNYMGLPTLTNPSGIVANVILPQYMHNSFDFGVGTHYKTSDKWMLRGALRFQETPTQTQYRGVSFPDEEKLAVLVGFRYLYNKAIMVDGLYNHVFIKSADIHDVNPVTNAVAVGKIRSTVNMVGLQLVWNVDALSPREVIAI